MLCPDGRLLQQPDRELRSPAASGWSAPIDPERCLRRRRRSAPGRPAWRPPSMPRPRASSAGARLPRVRRAGGSLGADRELPRLPDRHFGHGADGPRLQPGAEVRRRDGHPRRGREARMRCRHRPQALEPRQWRARSAPARSCSRPAPATAASTSPTSSEFEGSSIHYWASPLEAKLGAGQEVALVGGGNQRRPGDGVPRRPRRAGHHARPPAARRRPCRAIWSSASPALANVEVRRPESRSRELEGHERALRGDPLAGPGQRRRDAPPGPPSVPVHRRRARTPTGSPDRGIKLDERGFILTGPEAAAPAACRWKPAGRACSRSATSARARSSASPRRSATAPRWSPRCTRISPTRRRSPTSPRAMAAEPATT